MGAATVECLWLVAVAAWSWIIQTQGQQTYVNNKQLDCYNPAFNNFTHGFDCNGLRSSCQSYLTFCSARPHYDTPVSIFYLLGVPESASLLASLNNVSSDVAAIPSDTQLIVPVTYSYHARRYYQHNAIYALKLLTET